MHFTQVSLLSVALLQTFSIASPVSTTSSALGTRPIPVSFDASFDHAANYQNVAANTENVGRASVPAGYSVDGRCGPKHEGLMCSPNSNVYTGTCCSREGWCGSTAEYCADGCVSGCFNRATANQHDFTAIGRCGPSFENRDCDANGPYGGCCNSEGWCGSTSLYCDISEGCLKGCNSPGPAFLATTKAQPNIHQISSASSSNIGTSRSTTIKSSLRSIYVPARSPNASGSSPRPSSIESKTTTWSFLTDQKTSKLSSQLPGGDRTMSNAIYSSFKSQITQVSKSKTSTSAKEASRIGKPSTFLPPLISGTSSASESHLSVDASLTFRSLALTRALSSSSVSAFNSLSLSDTSGAAISARTFSFSSHDAQSFSRLPTSSISSVSNTSHKTSSESPASSYPSSYISSPTKTPPSIITISGLAHSAIATNITSSTSSIPSVVAVSRVSHLIYRSSQTFASGDASLSFNLTPSASSIPFGNHPPTSIQVVSSTTGKSSILLMPSPVPDQLSPSLMIETPLTRSSSGPLFSPSNAAQAACANPFESFPNGTNGLGLTIECFITLGVVDYLKNWISTNYPKVCTGSLEFSTCFEEYLGIYDAGTDCTGIKIGSCTGFSYSADAHMNWDVREIYILQSIYGINQFFASWYNGLLGAQSGAALTIGAIVNRLNPPKTTNVLLNDILAALSFGLSAFTLPDEIVKAVQGLEMIEDAIRATPGFVRSFTPEKTSNDQLQIGDIQAQLGAVVGQFLTQISNATAAIETNATAFTIWASTGLFTGNLVFLDQMVQDNYKYLNTFVLGQALNANNIVATVGLNTNVAQLQANSSDSLSYDIKCPGYDNNSMCNGWWYDATEDASFALDNLNSMSKNMQDDLSYFFDSGWTNGTLIFEDALRCQRNGGGDPVLNISPGTALGAMAQCFSSVKLCTWNLGCDLDSQCEFKECPTQSGFGVNGCGDDEAAIYDFNVPYNYLGTFLTNANPSSDVCNNGP